MISKETFEDEQIFWVIFSRKYYGEIGTEEVYMKKFLTGTSIVVCLISLVGGFSFAGTPSEAEKKGTVAVKEPPPEKERLPDNFATLREKRARLLKEIPTLERQLDELKSRERQTRFIVQDLERAKLDLERAKGEKPVNQGRVLSIQDFMRRLEANLSEAKDAAPLIKPREQELAKKTAELEEVEQKIDELLNPEVARQKFKTWMSMTFAGLVAIVIIGFFIIAFRDDAVRRAIFSGQSGIQFLTLFSLVIAIILFGITGILEGKELAALLGGLSGYILGRVTSTP